MTSRDRYRIGGEHYAAAFFVVVYFALGLLFANVKVSLVTIGLYGVALALSRLGYEFPLAVYIRTIHIIFIGLVLLSALKVF